MTAVEVLEAGGHAYPAVQVPVQEGDVRPLLTPKVPPGHSLHWPAPARLYRPGGHISAVAEVEPGAHAYPAVQVPEQVDTTSPLEAPNVPAGHWPVQLGVVRAGRKPYRPGAQAVQPPAPAVAYHPAGHIAAVALVEAGGHAYPASQTPEQLEDARAAS